MEKVLKKLGLGGLPTAAEIEELKKYINTLNPEITKTVEQIASGENAQQ